MITVGFVRTSVSVNESQSVENVCFEVTSGTIDRDVMVTVRQVTGPGIGVAVGKWDRQMHRQVDMVH